MNAWQAASLAGDVDAIMNLTAPGFMGWDLAKPAPVDRATYRTLEEYERFYWGHLVILFKRQGFETTYRIEGDDVLLALSRS